MIFLNMIRMAETFIAIRRLCIVVLSLVKSGKVSIVRLLARIFYFLTPLFCSAPESADATIQDIKERISSKLQLEKGGNVHLDAK